MLDTDLQFPVDMQINILQWICNRATYVSLTNWQWKQLHYVYFIEKLSLRWGNSWQMSLHLFSFFKTISALKSYMYVEFTCSSNSKSMLNPTMFKRDYREISHRLKKTKDLAKNLHLFSQIPSTSNVHHPSHVPLSNCDPPSQNEPVGYFALTEI